MAKKNFDLFEFLASIKLAVILLIVLAITSIFGTVIPQNESFDKYVHLYGEVWARIIATFELYDMYHSWWFIFLLAFFTLNLIVCSVKRLPPVINQLKNPKKILDESIEKNFNLVDTLRKKGAPDSWTKIIREYLQKKYGKIEEQEIDGKTFFYIEKGKYSRLGVYITHLSIIIILIGGMIGAIWGFRGFVQIPEGEAVNYVFVRGKNEPLQLDFFLRCDDFSLSYYPMGMVKEYRSDVSIIEKGNVVKKDYLIVNRPLTYKGLTFYQSSYGVINRSGKVYVFTKTGDSKSFELSLSDKFLNIPGSNDYVRIIDYYPNLDNVGPAIILQLSEEGRMPVNFPVYKNLPDRDMNPLGKYFFKFIDYSESYYTGLQVTKDPGVWVVWIGCIIMMVGLYVSFFINRKRIWAKVAFEGDKTTITIAGYSQRAASFEEEFAKIIEDLKELKA